MMEFFNLLFCSLYKSFTKDKKDRTPEWSVICILSLFIFFNTITVYYYFKILIQHRAYADIPKIFLLAIILSYLIFFYLIFIKDKKYLAIYEKFQTKGIRNSALITNLYLIFSSIALISLLFI